MEKQSKHIFKEIIENRKLIGSLAKNDFKTKFAGSYLGIIWAFVNPVVTVLLYWFVFEVALPQRALGRGNISVPFVLWLIAGLVPWFFFSDCLGAGTAVLNEYNYLVKKVVFNIDILPVVKVASNIFVHIFFVLFGMVIFACMGFFPNLYFLQVIYYSYCIAALVLGLTYLTSAVNVFFPDLRQVVNIALQIGIWMTPIMWNIDDVAQKIPAAVLMLIKANPMYYIVCGYRDSFITGIGFWEKPELTIYFWVFTVAVFILGVTVFKRLKVHFADVL